MGKNIGMNCAVENGCGAGSYGDWRKDGAAKEQKFCLIFNMFWFGSFSQFRFFYFIKSQRYSGF